MKKISIIFAMAVLFLHTTELFSQTEKGDWLAGGGGSLFFLKDNTSTQSSFTLSPRVGYFVRNNFALGLSMPVGYSNSWLRNSFDDYGFNNFSWGLGLFGRYYFLPNKTKLFLQGEYGITRLATRMPANSFPFKYSENKAFYRLGVGAVHFITPNVGVEAILDYRKQNVEFLNSERKGWNIEIGLFSYLGRKNSAGAEKAIALEAGSWLMGGGLGLSTVNNDRQNSRNFSISPRIGYFIKNRWAVGAVIPLTFYRLETNNSIAGNTTSSLSVTGNSLAMSAFTRYYFLPNRFKIYLQGQAGFISYHYQFGENVVAPSSSRTSTFGGFTYAVGAGMTYFIAPSVAVEATLDYRNQWRAENTQARILNAEIGLFLYLR